jgi:hypothetical protein
VAGIVPRRTSSERSVYGGLPYRYGIGTTSLVTRYVARISGAERLGAGVESRYGAVVVEMGISGLVAWKGERFSGQWRSKNVGRRTNLIRESVQPSLNHHHCTTRFIPLPSQRHAFLHLPC